MLEKIPYRTEITAFDGEYRFLSNFWPAEVMLNGDHYATVEHAYQAAKTTSHAERMTIRFADTPGKAKRLGRQVKLRTEWNNESFRIATMSDLVFKKFFNHEHLKESLLATGEAVLIEGNAWNDTFWGVCRGEGQNHLDKILMETRDKIGALE